jgi:hypothetical protein
VTAANPPLLPGPIGFVLIPQFASIALASAIEPLRIANRYLRNAYRWKLLSLDGQPVADGNGITVQPQGSVFDEPVLGSVIVCADVHPERHYSRELRSWLQQQDAAGASLGALDTGCFLLARAGLLDGIRVTMHWEVLDAFRERFTRTVVAQTLFELDGRRLTCAGGTAAIDMVLEAIARDHGSELAARVAEHCLHERMRPGGAAQRMAPAARGRFEQRHPIGASACPSWPTMRGCQRGSCCACSPTSLVKGLAVTTGACGSNMREVCCATRRWRWLMRQLLRASNRRHISAARIGSSTAYRRGRIGKRRRAVCHWCAIGEGEGAPALSPWRNKAIARHFPAMANRRRGLTYRTTTRSAKACRHERHPSTR